MAITAVTSSEAMRRAMFAVLVAGLVACDEGSAPTRPTSTTVSPAIPDAPVPAVPRPPLTGRVAFVSDRDGADAIYVANADGSGVRRLTVGWRPAWAPGRDQLAFERDGVIYIIGGDGRERRVASGRCPGWSPDGNKLVFVDNDGIKVINADGSGMNHVLNPSVWNTEGVDYYGIDSTSWSPDGRTIAFIRTNWDMTAEGPAVWVIDADGQAEPRQLFVSWGRNSGVSGWRTSWSPDGSRIAVGGSPGFTLVIDATGSRFEESPGFDADWTPTGDLVFSQLTVPGPGGPESGSGMRIYTSRSDTPLLPEAAAPHRADYSDFSVAWSR